MKQRMKPNAKCASKAIPSMAKKRRYDDTFLAFGFTCTTVGNQERPQSVVCLKALACDSLKLNKLRRHLETKHPEHKAKPVEFFRQKLVNCHAQQSFFTKAASVPANAQLASYKVAYKVAQCKKPHKMAEELILSCAMDMDIFFYF